MTISNLVIVVGKAASGKTTLCKLMADPIYEYISASDILRRAFRFADVNHNRRSLADRGGLARGTPDLLEFHNALLQRINEMSGDVILDGPRFAETVNAIRSSAVRSLLVYLDCPDAVRLQRLIDDGRSSDWAWLAQHPTETSVAEMRDIADVILDGAIPASDVLENLKKSRSEFFER